MTSRRQNIEILKELIRTINKASANIDCEEDFNINRNEQKQLKKQIINDNRYLMMTEDYIDRRNDRR